VTIGSNGREDAAFNRSCTGAVRFLATDAILLYCLRCPSMRLSFKTFECHLSALCLQNPQTEGHVHAAGGR
jgi:hypothetical protein